MTLLEEWLTLIHVDQLGPVTFNKLLDKFHCPDAILNAGRGELYEMGISSQVANDIITPDENSITHDLEWLQHDCRLSHRLSH